MDSFGTLLSSYSNERQIYRRMVMIGMEADVAIKVVGFYLCLESLGHLNMIRTIASLDNMTLSLVAAEAQAALAQIESDETTRIPSYVYLPLISNIAGHQFALTHFNVNRQSFREGLSQVLDGVCNVIFMGVLDERLLQAQAQAQAQARARAQSRLELIGSRPVRPFGEGSSRQEAAIQGLAERLSGLSMFSPSDGPSRPPNQSLRIGLTATGSQRRTLDGLPIQTDLNPMARPWNPYFTQSRVPVEQRTLFLTFSVGCALTENEIYSYFTRRYGDCVESVYVNRHNPRGGVGPSLFGKVVFRSASTIRYLMSGLEVIKLTVAGKPLWCRRFDASSQGRWRRRR